MMNGRIYSCVFTLSLFALGQYEPAVATAQLSNSPWPDYGGGLSNTHQTSAVGPSENVQLLWEYELSLTSSTPNSPNQAFRQPVLGEDGTIFFTAFSTGDGMLTALNRDGSPKWVQTGNTFGFWPAVDSGGMLYHENYPRRIGRGSFYSRQQSDGEIVWATSSTNDPFESGPTVGSDGTIYSGLGGLTASSDAGVQHWNYSETASQYKNPAITTDGTIIVGGQSSVLAIDSTGELDWSYSVGTRVGPISIGPNGNIYAGSANALSDRLISLSPDGSERWVRNDVGGAPAIGLDGNIYAGYRGTLHAIDPDTGDDIWTFATGPLDEFGVEGVTVDGEGNIFLANNQGIVMSITPAGQLRWQFDLAPDSSGEILPSAPVIGTNSTIYVAGGLTGSFFAIGVIPEPTTLTLATLSLLAAAYRPGSRRRH